MSSLFFEITGGGARTASDFHYDEYVKYNKILNPNCDCEMTDEVKRDLTERVRTTFKRFLERKLKASTVEYLMENLEVSVVDSFEDRWENGEVFYWLQHSGVVVNQ